MDDPLLSWRIPTTGDPRLLRIALAQVGLATIVAALALLVAVPRHWLGAALFGLIPLAIFMAYWRWNAYQRSLAGPDNVRIDDAGVHWIDAAGQQRAFRRDEITAFHISREEATLRPVPALTLHLASGFESQPVELHPPATADNVREFLQASWHIPEESPKDDSGYDTLAQVYSECHEEFQEWHFEGTKEELSRFFALFAATADELPLPPPGTKPKARIVLASRREPLRLHLAHAAGSHLEPDTIVATDEVLRKITENAAAALTSIGARGDGKFDVQLGPRDAWTFHLHVHAI